MIREWLIGDYVQVPRPTPKRLAGEPWPEFVVIDTFRIETWQERDLVQLGRIQEFGALKRDQTSSRDTGDRKEKG